MFEPCLAGFISHHSSLLGVSACGKHNRMRSQMAPERSRRSRDPRKLVMSGKRFLEGCHETHGVGLSP